MKDTFLDGVALTVFIIILLLLMAIAVYPSADNEPEAITSTVCISLEDYTALTTKE